ncbi:MAG: CotH kinase family protein, partial [Oscillospiraceae bacterium]|nr:CotH kinase family protein [Oscillospiraceae bacterium]
KWHLLFYDLDAAFRSFESIQSNLLNDYGASQIQVASFSVPLMKNAQFREKFLTRAAELLAGPLSNKALLKELDAMAEELRPEVKRDYERVGSNLDSWERSIADLRSMIEDRDWEQANIDGLCRTFELDKAERIKYFGAIDKLAAEKAVVESAS